MTQRETTRQLADNSDYGLREGEAIYMKSVVEQRAADGCVTLNPEDICYGGDQSSPDGGVTAVVTDSAGKRYLVRTMRCSRCARRLFHQKNRTCCWRLPCYHCAAVGCLSPELGAELPPCCDPVTPRIQIRRNLETT